MAIPNPPAAATPSTDRDEGLRRPLDLGDGAVEVEDLLEDLPVAPGVLQGDDRVSAVFESDANEIVQEGRPPTGEPVMRSRSFPQNPSSTMTEKVSASASVAPIIARSFTVPATASRSP
jgi:hypothetical protein